MKRDAESLKDSSGVSFINDNGIYDVVINFASVEKKPSGALFFNLNVDYNGNSQTFYGPCIQDKTGKETFGMGLLRKFGVIADVEDGDFNIETETHVVGKDNKEMEFQVITDLSDLECKIRVQVEYSKYEGKIRRSLEVRNVFAADGASASEIVSDGEIGKQYALELEKYSSTTSYKDGVTPEEAADFDEEQAAARSGKATEAPKRSATRSRRSGVFG